jgi:phenylacetic acid degradation protein paaN
MTTATDPAVFTTKHRALLDGALDAIRTRAYFSGYPESPSPKVYGESAAAEGKAAFEARFKTTFALEGVTTGETVSTEKSPFGLAMNVAYGVPDVEGTIAAAVAAGKRWGAASIDERAGVALEALARINARSFELANAVQHTSGQAFVMAFQAGGPHAQDRALEAIAYAYAEMARIPASVLWEKPAKPEPIRVEKTYRVVPRGVALVIGCNTFPTWNTYPGLFASFMTGNAVIIKPHPLAILPLAITVEIMQDVLREAGFDPKTVQLAVDTPTTPLAKVLATRPEVAIVDYTGSTGFGDWLEANAHGQVYTEKAGVNSVVIDSTADLKGLAKNLAMSWVLYSGQMCTTPQNVFVPAGGIDAGGEHVAFDDLVTTIVGAVDGICAAPERAVELLGAIAADATLERIAIEGAKPGIVRPSQALAHPAFPHARVQTPMIAVVDSSDHERFSKEAFGPIVFIVKTKDTNESLELATREAHDHGAITAIVHSTDPAVVTQAADWADDGMVNLAVNFTGNLLVNQSAAFSDYHVTGGNPAGNASLCDAAFVANRFRVIETRTPVL